MDGFFFFFKSEPFHKSHKTGFTMFLVCVHMSVSMFLFNALIR